MRPSALAKNHSRGQGRLPDRGLHVLDAWPDRLAFLGRRQEDPRARFRQFCLPLRDLIGVNIKLLRQFGQHFVALQCC
jgi:hypothetical protein